MIEAIVILGGAYLAYRYVRPKKRIRKRQPTKRQSIRRPQKPKLETPEALHLTETQEQIAAIQDRLWDLDEYTPQAFEIIRREIIDELEDLELTNTEVITP